MGIMQENKRRIEELEIEILVLLKRGIGDKPDRRNAEVVKCILDQIRRYMSIKLKQIDDYYLKRFAEEDEDFQELYTLLANADDNINKAFQNMNAEWYNWNLNKQTKEK